MKVLFVEFFIWLAKFGPILVKYELNVFAIVSESFICGIFYLVG